MGGDREFFSDTEHGFQVWKPELAMLPPGASIECMSNVCVPSTGRYYLQFLCDERLTIRFGNTLFEKFALPMFHNEVKEIPLDLKKGRTQLNVHLSNSTSLDLPPKFTARLLDEDGYVLFPERIAPLPEIGECRPAEDKPALDSWTPGAEVLGSSPSL